MTSRQLDEEAIFHVARSISEPEMRSTYLDQICAGDQALRERVEALLEVHEKEQSFLKSSPDPAPTVDHTMVAERPGATIGRFKLMEQLGEGGMGTVFVGQQERPIRRKVAIKVIKPGMDSKAVVARFEAERQALAMMDHPNIAKVLDAGTTESGRPYFAMELVKGIPITEYCDKNKLTIRERLDLFIQVCQAIQHAHQKGIIHRDIKPSNVLVTLHDGKPVPKVIDFGVAKAVNARLTDKTIYTEHLQIVGTLLYMSPEQAELSGLDVDTRSDVYSLGVLLYELLTGTTPFQKAELDEAGFDEQRRIIRETDPPRASQRISSLGDTATSIAAHRKTDPKKLQQSVRGDLDWIVVKALEKDRTRRYDTASGLADDVCRCLSDEPIVARPPSSQYRIHMFVRRNKRTVTAAIAVAIVICVALCVTIVALIRANQEKTKAEELAAQIAQRADVLTKRNEIISQLYFRQIHNLVMIGKDELARQVIDEVQREKLIIDGAKVNFLEGQRCLYSGRTVDSFVYFQKAIELDRDWVLPRAALAMAHILGCETTGHRSAFHHAEELARKQIAQGQPLSEHEEMFLDHLRCILGPASESSIARLTQIAEEELTPLANALLADALTHRASATGDYDDIQNALDRANNAVQNLPDNCCVLGFALHAHTVALALPCMSGQRAHLMEEGRRLAERLREFPEYPTSFCCRAALYNLDDDVERLREMLPHLPRHSGITAFYAAASLIQHGKYDEAEALFPSVEDTGDVFSLHGRANTVAFTQNSEREIKDIYLTLGNVDPGKWWTHECLLLMQGDDSYRTSECQAAIKRTLATGWDLDLLNFIGEGTYNEATSNALLASASESKEGSRRRISRSNFVIAFKCLAENDRKSAKKHLMGCQEDGYLIEHIWARAFLARLEEDPSWPFRAGHSRNLESLQSHVRS